MEITCAELIKHQLVKSTHKNFNSSYKSQAWLFVQLGSHE